MKTPQGTVELRSDAIFLAAGRVPNVQGMQLDKAGVEHDRRGIGINDYLQTSAPNIYACGDVASPAKFTHVASHQAGLCVQNILNGNTRENDLSVLPWVIFTDPRERDRILKHAAQELKLPLHIQRLGTQFRGQRRCTCGP